MENRAYRIPEGTRFLLMLVQPGEGCDYTIGCGVRIEPLKATTVEEARAETVAFFAHEDNQHHLRDDGEYALSHAVLVTAHEEFDLDPWKARLRSREEAEASAAKTASDLAELDRLQRKYGGPGR